MTATPTTTIQHEKLVSIDQQLRNLTSDRETLSRQIADATEQCETAVLDGGKRPDAKKLAALRTALEEVYISIGVHQGAYDKQAAIVADLEAAEPSRRRARFEAAIVEPAERLNAVVEDLIGAVDDAIAVHTSHGQQAKLEYLLAPGQTSERIARIQLINSVLNLRAVRAKFNPTR